MVYVRSDILVKRFSFKTTGENLFSLNECYFVHPHFFGSFFFLTHILCGIVYKENKKAA